MPASSGKIIIQLYDGREFTFVDKTADEVIAALRAEGVKKGDLKNTIHIIPKRNVLVLGGDGAGN